MSTKILFLVPMHITFDSFCNPTGNTRAYPKKDGRYYNSLSTDLPLGPISISAYLKKHIDVDVKLIDFNVELNLIEQFNYKTFYDYCFDFLDSYEYDPDIIAISSLFSAACFNIFI
jgi:anaerobic magnesium-protoporphyrin IX monomethyl ester cyclase